MTALYEVMIEDEDMHSLMMEKIINETQTSEGEVGEVIIKFKPGTEEEQIKAMASRIGMFQVKEIKALNLLVFTIPSDKSMEEVIKHCEKETFVEYDEPNQTYRTQK
jgi:hypothetical protein